MNIPHDCGADGSIDNPSDAQADARARNVLEQSAMYAAQLAIARWINSSSSALRQADMPGPEMFRARWHAQAQQDFEVWRGRGGFAQHGAACVDPGAPLTVPGVC